MHSRRRWVLSFGGCNCNRSSTKLKMDYKKPGELRVPKTSLDSTLISPDRSGSFSRGSFSLESPQPVTPTYDTRRKLSIIGKTSPFSTCIPAIELSSSQSLEVVDLDPSFGSGHSQHHHPRLVRTSSHQSPRMGRKDYSGDNDHPGGRRRSRHHLSINMSDFVSRPQSFDGTIPGLQVTGGGPNSRSMLLLPQGNPLGRRRSFIHQVDVEQENKNKIESFFTNQPTYPV